jgi:CRISPR-associated protein Csb3
MSEPTTAIRINVNPCNPGQFFACCGLLELANRLWGGAEGWFAEGGRVFCLLPVEASPDASASQFIESLAKCRLTSTMSAEEVARLQSFRERPKGKAKKPKLGEEQKKEKKWLESRWRDEPILLHAPFNLRLDWWRDRRAGGYRYKTWAGQQSVLDIASAMKRPIEAGHWRELTPSQWLSHSSGDNAVPFNFDSDLGCQSSGIDIGFSLDPLRMVTRTRPLIEFAAFIGLQRFRPASDTARNRHEYRLWSSPLLPPAAIAAACGRATTSLSPTFCFQLLYRTEYLKSFLPATPSRGDT